MKFLAFIKEYYKPFLIFFVIILLVTAAVGAAVFFIPFGQKDETIPDEVKLTILNETEKYDGALVYRSGKTYLDFGSIALSFGMRIGGDSESLRVSTAYGETIEFRSGEREVNINGRTVLMDEPIVTDGTVVYVPLSFIETYVSGIEVVISEDKTEINIKRGVSSSGIVSFNLKNDTPLGKVDKEGHRVVLSIDESELEYKFLNDYSSVKQYLNPSNRDDYLVLCAPSRPAASDFAPTDLVKISRLSKKASYKYELDKAADKALSAMLSEMDASGLSGMNAVRGYVSYSELKKNYQSALSKGNDAIAPGESDHLTGLGVDITTQSKADVSFAETEAYKWLKENAYKFGFIERYPEGAEKVTGMAYEPCHWRFVGQYHAAIMHREGYCLETYLDSIVLN